MPEDDERIPLFSLYNKPKLLNRELASSARKQRWQHRADLQRQWDDAAYQMEHIIAKGQCRWHNGPETEDRNKWPSYLCCSCHGDPHVPQFHPEDSPVCGACGKRIGPDPTGVCVAVWDFWKRCALCPDHRERSPDFADLQDHLITRSYILNQRKKIWDRPSRRPREQQSESENEQPEEKKQKTSDPALQAFQKAYAEHASGNSAFDIALEKKKKADDGAWQALPLLSGLVAHVQAKQREETPVTQADPVHEQKADVSDGRELWDEVEEEEAWDELEQQEEEEEEYC